MRPGALVRPLIQTTRGARPCDGHQPAPSRWFLPRMMRCRMSDRPSSVRGHLATLGAYGFLAQEPVILAALTSGDPIVLIGRSGTG